MSSKCFFILGRCLPYDKACIAWCNVAQCLFWSGVSACPTSLNELVGGLLISACCWLWVCMAASQLWLAISYISSTCNYWLFGKLLLPWDETHNWRTQKGMQMTGRPLMQLMIALRVEASCHRLALLVDPIYCNYEVGLRAPREAAKKVTQMLPAMMKVPQAMQPLFMTPYGWCCTGQRQLSTQLKQQSCSFGGNWRCVWDLSINM